MSELLSTSVTKKISKKSIEEDLSDILYKKFGERFLNYRKKYSEYLNNEKTNKTLDYPISVILELVNRCNLECTMCYQGFRNDIEKSVLSDWGDTLCLATLIVSSLVVTTLKLAFPVDRGTRVVENKRRRKRGTTGRTS